MPKFSIGDKVHYHPIIGESHDGKVYEIRDLGELGHGAEVAWLKGKAGCVVLEALSPASLFDATIEELREQHPGPKFMTIPEEWYDHNTWYCPCSWIGHMYIRSEVGPREQCPSCHSGVRLGPPPGTPDAERLLAVLARLRG